MAAWIDGRLDLAFDDSIGSDLRRLSLEAQSQIPRSGSARLRGDAQAAERRAARGLQAGVFHHIDPVSDAQFIHGVVWAGIDQHWATGDCDRDDLRERILRFCLRGLGVTT